ncbi:hypothetical protein [Pseudoxanthomonas sp. Root630]|uniref:hypothetical protein n=1 Tax=Pseudoxanthomonas sp. Root630 TaxID=1736574 RepID=UPI0007033514|nr:hypothetical protein [Pseudoxanthomonas sp. Root630]KRA46589.1 hypothetical protein ASD72_05175 [Pseudoxanthomonas sp. Root630]
MKTESTAAKNADARETRTERTIRLLMTITDPLQQKLQEFKVFYPAVAMARHNKMPNKQILRHLADGGLKLYPSLLENLIDAMEQAEGAPACQHCGHTLRTEPTATKASKSDRGEGDHTSESPARLVEEALASNA